MIILINAKWDFHLKNVKQRRLNNGQLTNIDERLFEILQYAKMLR
jgi:hypothetical protein